MAAVFSNGNVATGRHHGEAFSNLSCGDQDGDLISGHVNSDGMFTTEMEHPQKEIILVRHAESLKNAQVSEDFDSSITPTGVEQAQALARYLKNKIDCRGLVGFTSPYERCLMTSMPIRRHTGIRFFVRRELAESTKDFPEMGINVPCRKNRYLDLEWSDYETTLFRKEMSTDFVKKLQDFLASLPARSLIITHSCVVQTLMVMALGLKVKQASDCNFIKNASVTHIKDGTVVSVGKSTT